MKNKVWILSILLLFMFTVNVLAADNVPVKVTTVQEKTLGIHRVISGVLQPLKEVMVSAKTAGEVLDVRVEVGDWVEKGDVLIVFDTEQAKLQLQQAEAAVELAQANLDLLKKGASKEDRELATSSYDQAVVSYESALEGLETAESMFNDRTMEKQQLLGAKTQLDAAKLQVEMAREREDQAQSALDLASEDLERMTNLYQNGVITQKQFDGIKAQHDNAQSAVESARLATEQAELSFASAEESYQLAQDLYNNRTAAEQQLQGARTQLKIAEINVEVAKTNLEKIDKGAGAEQIRISEANLQQAKVGLEMAKIQLENAVIKSPISGVVAQLNIDAGEMSAPGTPVVMIIDTEKVHLKTDVSADVLTSLQVGEEVDVTVRAFPGKTFFGKIDFLSPMADPRTQAFTVKILIENNDTVLLRPGMFGEAQVTVQKSTHTSIVPIEAVLDLESTPYVYVVTSNNVAEKRQIRTGLVNNQEVEVLSGLKAGEKLVIMGQHSLTDGDEVEVISR